MSEWPTEQQDFQWLALRALAAETGGAATMKRLEFDVAPATHTLCKSGRRACPQLLGFRHGNEPIRYRCSAFQAPGDALYVTGRNSPRRLSVCCEHVPEPDHA